VHSVRTATSDEKFLIVLLALVGSLRVATAMGQPFGAEATIGLLMVVLAPLSVRR